MADDRYSFIVEWYDPHASFMRRYRLTYECKDGTVDMYDLRNHRPFLKKTKAENVRPQDLYIGATVNLLSRQLNVVEYADDYTAKSFGTSKEKTLAIIKPDAVGKIGQIMDLVYQSGFHIGRMRMCQVSRNEAQDFYSEHQGKPFFSSLLSTMTGGPVVAMEIMGENAVRRWRDLLGPTDSSEARAAAPASIRARYGTDATRNACHGSDSSESAARELEFFFPSTSGGRGVGCATFSDCTLCLIKPHAVNSGQVGAIISSIADAGFNISALQMFHLEKVNAEEFLEVYKGVVQEYPAMVMELTSGPVIAMEIRAQEAARVFREFVGPADPEIARHLRPRTLRAQFGKDKIQNAVHCTDLPEDGVLEVEYFFKILSQ